MAAQPRASSSTKEERRRRTLLLVLLAALVVVLILVFSVCSGGGDDDSAAGDTTTAPSGASDTTQAATGTTAVTTAAPAATTAAPTTSAAATSDTTADPFAVFNVTEPRDTTTEWTCTEPEERGGGGGYALTCSADTRDLMFVQGYFISTVTFTQDANGDRIGAALLSSSYGPNCMWRNEDPTPQDVPIVDGKATHSGSFLGDGRCEGIRWRWESTWDTEAGAAVITGTLEPVT